MILQLAKVGVSERGPDELVLEMQISTTKFPRASSDSLFMISGPVLIDFTESKELLSSPSMV